jgi:antitoxin FitA
MPNLSIKDVPEVWAQALRERALSNHRSLQGELLAMVEQFVSASPAFNLSPNTQARRPKSGALSIQDLYAKSVARSPKPDAKGPLSVDLIRQDRDSR